MLKFMPLKQVVSFLQKRAQTKVAGHETYELPLYFFSAARALKGKKVGLWQVTEVNKGSNGEFEFKGTWGPEAIYIGFMGANDQEPEWVWELVIEEPYTWKEAEYDEPEVEPLGFPPENFRYLFGLWASGGEYEFDQESFDKYCPATVKPLILKYLKEARDKNPEETLIEIPKPVVLAEMKKAYSPTPQSIAASLRSIIESWKRNPDKYPTEG